MILNGINFACTFLGLYIVEHFGRRKSLMCGSAWMVMCFLVFGSVGHFSLNQEFPDRTPGASIAMIVFACLFIFGYAITWVSHPHWLSFASTSMLTFSGTYCMEYYCGVVPVEIQSEGYGFVNCIELVSNSL